VVPTFLGLARDLIEITKSTVRLQPLVELFTAPSAPTGGSTPLPSLPTTIALRNVSFAYGVARGATPAPPALADLSLDWRAGEVLVLTGANGSGKSTCLRLFLALAEPASGTIEIGATPLFDLDLVAWRRAIAYLPQRPFFPERATVRSGVRHIARDADDAAIEAALARVNLLAALESRSATPLDVSVSSLSVGQRQRLALARALVQAKAAKVLVLDEPDANLDAEGIALVAEIVRELAPTRMIVIAAHTPQLIAPGDQVVKLVAGKIA
jgi:ABC-type bacteriocin/lantibiotic exporter with double-glycine peptidase domain